MNVLPPQSASSSAYTIGLAPMEGVSDLPTRLWYSLIYPPEFMSTPFWRISSHHSNPRHHPLFISELSDLKGLISYQLVPQIMADTPKAFLEGAEIVLKSSPFVDLNCGCPSRVVTGRGAGSSLLADTQDFKRFVGNLCNAIGSEHLSIKLRSGYGEAPDTFQFLLEAISDLSLARLTLHSRTRLQRYRGKADWSLIAQATEQMGCPVFGSGDVVALEIFEKKIAEAPKIAGLIIGRGALRNPWIFLELHEGQSVEMSLPCLITSLTCFALLRSLYWYKPQKLQNIAETGLFLHPCENRLEDWENAMRILSPACFNSEISIQNMVFDRRVLSMLKMLWSYMRSSLPGPFFSATPLRCSTFLEFISSIENIDQLYQNTGLTDSSPYLLRYNPHYDWVYSGEANPNIKA